MTIFIGVVLNKATSDIKNRAPLYQEVVVEVKAFDEASARQAIEANARKEETSYKNAAGDTITWAFDKIQDVSVVLEENFTDGVRQLHARHFKVIGAYNKTASSG